MSDSKKGTAVAGTASKVRKNTSGIPRVTDKVLALDEAGRAAWLAEKTKGLSAAIVAEVKTRLDEALAGGRTPKKVNFKAAFMGRPYAELIQVRSDLNEAIKESAKVEEDNLNKVIAQAEQQKKELADRKAAEAEVS